MSAGFIYVLSNPSMPGVVKIGRTTRHPFDRARELYKTASGVPLEFHVESAVWSDDCEASEADVHHNLDGLRVNSSREFFRVDVDQAIAEVINCTAGMFHGICAAEHYVAEPFILQMARDIGVSESDVCEAIEFMTQKDIEILLRRVTEWRSARIAKQNARIEHGSYEY